MKEAIVFAYHNDLRIAPKPNGEVGGADIAVIFERNMTDVRRKDD